MDDARRKALLEKRGNLQEKLGRREANACLAALHAAGLSPVELVGQAAEEQLARLSRLPAIDEHVDWTRVDGATLCHWTDLDERNEAARKALPRHAGAARLVVYWSPKLPIVLIEPAALRASVVVVLDMATETTLFPSARHERWLIENSHFERVVGFAPVILP